jgi:hypothetical protein
MSFPVHSGLRRTIYTESNEKDDANSKVSAYMWVTPGICTACPVERQKHKSSSGDQEERAYRITSPYELSEAHLRVIGAFLGPVEGEQPDRSDAM